MIKNLSVIEKNIIVSILQKYAQDNEHYVLNSNASEEKKAVATIQNKAIYKVIQ